jgi:hypothetical protein
MAILSGVKNAIGSLNPFAKRQASPLAQPQAPSTTMAQPQTNTPQSQENMGSINLVNYTPEQLIQHVDQDVARIQFGWSATTRWMEGFAEVWSWMGPVVLVVGTIGEVFLVLWLRQRVQDILAGVSIVAVALVLECTFLTVSYKSATIRNRAERRPGGPNDLDRRKLKKQLAFWVALGFGVCATQVIFVAAQTMESIPGQGGSIGIYGVWIFAILRAVFTLVADGYTAFAHEEKPTTAERALEEREQRAKAADQLLQAKRREVTLINEGVLDVRKASVEAQIRDDKMTTQLAVERMQNEGQIKALAAQQETAGLTIAMFSNLQRALLDPTVPPEERQAAINLMVAIGKGYQQLQQKTDRINRIVEEKNTGDL